MSKHKNFNRRALSFTSTRTHLERRRSVELMNLSSKPVRASRVQGFQGPYGGSQLVLTLYRIYIFCFQMCNRLPELMKNGDAGVFLVFYSLKWVLVHSCTFTAVPTNTDKYQVSVKHSIFHCFFCMDTCSPTRLFMSIL